MRNANAKIDQSPKKHSPWSYNRACEIQLTNKRLELFQCDFLPPKQTANCQQTFFHFFHEVALSSFLLKSNSIPAKVKTGEGLLVFSGSIGAPTFSQNVKNC